MVEERRQADGLLVLSSGKAASSWSFSSWRRVSSAAYGGFDLVASRDIREGEIIVRESPLLHAAAPDHNEAGWATNFLKSFCAASKAVRIAVLATHAVGQHEAAAASAYHEMHNGAVDEVALCTDLPWRLACPEILDSTLCDVCLIAQLNSYAFGAGRIPDIHYAAPSSAEPGAHWLCGRCGPRRRWDMEQVLPSASPEP